jgi:uncharacterized membrane protein
MEPLPPVGGMTAAHRALIVVAIAFVVGLATAPFAPWQLSPLAGWIAGGAWWLMSVWQKVRRFTPEETELSATREDNSRIAAELLLVSASVASLLGTGFVLLNANQADGGGKALLTIVAILTVVVSWSMVHTVFALRYGHLYYTRPVGGIDFKSDDERPDYHDFAYAAFTIGMTFQVSDTDIQSRRIRRSVLAHALLAYLFGAVIVAVAVNTIAGIFFK